jgi:hypothetical protein
VLSQERWTLAPRVHSLKELLMKWTYWNASVEYGVRQTGCQQNWIIANKTDCFTYLLISLFQKRNPGNTTWHAEFTEVRITDIKKNSSRHYSLFTKVADISINRWLYQQIAERHNLTYVSFQHRNVKCHICYSGCSVRKYFHFSPIKIFLTSSCLSTDRHLSLSWAMSI